jgi:Ribosomal protein S21e
VTVLLHVTYTEYLTAIITFHCSSATNRLITAKDHASVQLNIGHLDENGIYTGQFTTFALSGSIRSQVSFFSSENIYLHVKETMMAYLHTLLPRSYFGMCCVAISFARLVFCIFSFVFHKIRGTHL